MNDVLRIARLKIALQRAFLGQAILRVIYKLCALGFVLWIIIRILIGMPRHDSEFALLSLFCHLTDI